MKPFLVRNMSAEDMDTAFALLNLNLDDWFAPEVPRFFLSQWPDGQLVAMSFDGEALGVLCGARLPNGRGSISLLAVDSPFRRYGVGTRLLYEFRRRCIMYGISEMQLEVRSTNISAISFYERNGFVRREALPRFYNDGGDGIRMTADVSSARINLS